ncbi:hypothetical protein C8T65DRAFT_672602 [Cerioporus squamosus]|nr:hypothetical protein C8T65DRAFT_672602 [Cerioporus squamosus]
MANSTLTESLPYRDASVGDLIIRTSDDVEFHVHHRRVADVCPIFADMATLPDHPSDTGEREKAVVQVSETSKVWEKLLPICHLAEEPPLSLGDIQNLLEAGRKYGMTGVASRMRTALLHPDFLEKKPYAVYALACAGGFEDVALLAAQRTLRFPIYPQDSPEFASITGRALYRLFDYRQRCGIAASAVVASETTSGGIFYCPPSITYPEICKAQTCGRNGSRCATPSTAAYFLGSGFDYDVLPAWITYLKLLRQQLESRPDGSLAESPDLMQAVSDYMSACATCQNAFYHNAAAFVRKIKTKVEDAIQQVDLVLEK